jgi:hypothetical protein
MLPLLVGHPFRLSANSRCRTETDGSEGRDPKMIVREVQLGRPHKSKDFTVAFPLDAALRTTNHVGRRYRLTKDTFGSSL